MGKLTRVKILCVPGVGHAVAENQWFDTWRSGIDRILTSDGYDDLDVQLIPFRYRKIFDDQRLDGAGYSQALADLGFGVGHSALGKLFRTTSGLDPLAEALKWRAATIAHWAENDEIRKSLVEDLRESMIEHQPDLVLAHALGSLVAYDCMLELSDPFIENRSLITFGSQLGNPYVRNLYAGRIKGLALKQWYNLYNQHDSVFTSPLHLQDANYALVNVDFNNQDPLDHTAISTGMGSIGYLDHLTTRQLVWPNVLRPEKRSPFVRSVRRAVKFGEAFDSPDHRALLIGIDEYAHASVPNLGGCVNDTYLMSETLQSAGFPADNIRLVHNARATTDAIRDRIEWLLDDIDAGDPPEFRLLHFSGHGAQLESYGVGESVDRLDECLCPHDFDWSVERSLLDDLFCSIYSQLPYGAHFVVVLDCCHSGGMARNGEGVRGLSGPRDVAHRGLYFEPGDASNPGGTWRRKGATDASRLPGSLRVDGDHPFQINGEFFGGDEDEEKLKLWLGNEGTTRKIGRSASLRKLGSKEYDAQRQKLGHHGPYLPTIFEACREDEPAQEHIQGSTAYGAFTFAFAQAVRGMLESGGELRYEAILARTKRIVRDLGYVQVPQLLIPPAKDRITLPKMS